MRKHSDPILALLAEHRYSALMLSRKIGLSRPVTSRVLQGLRKAGLVEHDGAWGLTEKGRDLPTKESHHDS